MARIDGKSPPLGPLTPRPSEATPRPAPRGRPADPQARTELQTEAERLGPSTARRAPRPESGEVAREVPAGLPQRKLSQAEAERLMSQAGFSRMHRKRGRGVELDDVTQGPIPLPADEVDETAWDQPSLDDAQEKLSLQGSQLAALQTQAAPGEDELGLFARLTEQTSAPTEAEVARLQALQDAPPPPPVQMEDVRSHLQRHFGLDLGQVPTGPALAACSLVVGGLAAAVQPLPEGLGTQAFAGGLQTLVERGGRATDDARVMSSGITKQRALQATLIKKR